jgi:ankyrin repeat protein
VNQKLFRGYATTAAAREGHEEVMRALLKAGASQAACEEALLEACLSGQRKMAELLVSWEMARPDILASALIHASSRGLVDIVELLIKARIVQSSVFRFSLHKPAFVWTGTYVYNCMRL